MNDVYRAAAALAEFHRRGGTPLGELKETLLADELAAALRPFEEMADEGNEDQPDDTKCVIHAGRTIHYGIRLGQFRHYPANAPSIRGA